MKVLVVGHGPSYNDYDYIKNFDGLILCVDKSTPDLINHGIIPDYMLWWEINEGVKNIIDLCLPIYPKKVRDKMVVIYRFNMWDMFVDRIKRYRMKWEIFNDKLPNNVGLYSIVFADKILKADEIHLIGLDYGGTKEYGDDVYTAWIDETRAYLKSRTAKGKIIDHSNGNFPN